MRNLVITVIIVFIFVSSVYPQNAVFRLNDKPISDFASRLAFEVGLSNSYPIQNLAQYNTSAKYQFAGFIYANLINNFSAYFNYSYIHCGNQENLPPDDVFYIPKNTFRVYNIGGNYSFEYKNHIPFVEAGVGLYSFSVLIPHSPPEFIYYESASETQFGANLGAGYRYLFERRFGLFIKGKYHTFTYNSKYWSFWNLSAGLYLKF